MKTVTDELFNELKNAAMEVWQTYDNTYGYVDEKIAMMNFPNVKDNYGTIIGMFDVHNQRKLYDKVSDEAKALIDDWVGGLEKSEKLAKELGL